MKPLPLQNTFKGGMRQDDPRNRLALNAAWNLQDVILDYGAPLRERGGWAYANAASAISAVTGTASYIRGGLYAIFSPTGGDDPALLCLDEDGLLYEINTSTGVPTLIGAARTIAQNPVFHGGTAASAASAVYTGLVIIPDATLAAVPKKYDGTSISDLGGTPPKAKFATVYKDYTVLAHGYVGSTYYPNRAWYSPPGDPDCGFSGTVTAWDTTDSWLDFSLSIQAAASTKNAHLFFHDGQISRVRGSVPPPDEDFVVDDPWQRIGLLDPFSITEYQDMIYWCAPEGVYRTDGALLDDLTVKGGMSRYWLDLVANATSAWTVATGVIRNRLIIALMDGTTFKDAFMVDLGTYAWTRLTNLDAVSFWTGQYNEADETYFARRGATYVGRTQTMFNPISTYKSDANGTAVAALIETPFYDYGRPGIKTVKSLFAGIHLADYASDNPTVAVSYVDTPEETSYTSLGTLAETTAYDRKRLSVGGRHWGMGFKFTRSGAGDFHLFDLTAEVGFQEETKRMT